MKRIIALFTLCLLVISYVIPVSAAVAAQDDIAPWYDTIPDMLAAGEYEEGVVIVGIDMSKAKKAGELRDDAEEIMTDDISIAVIRRDDMTTAQLLEQLASDESILFAEPNYIMNGSAEDDIVVSDAAADDAADDSSARDMSSIQWGNSADTSFRGADSTENYSMNVPGWPDGSNMDHEIIVAVIDDAVDYTNPDLADRMYIFTPEQQAELGCDEYGYNATWESTDGKLEYYEDHDHGTHVAGIIAASWDGSGISGVGSDVRIVSVQNNVEDGKTSLVNALRAMDFIKRAKESGVDIRIVNCSWQVLQNSKALDAAITELGEVGIVTFFAAGNDAEDLGAVQHIQGTLADNPYAIIVASTDVTGNLASSSDYGNGIATLAAPGVDIFSTIMDDHYIPMMANKNTFYEDFEGNSPALQIYQIDPQNGEKVAGSDGQIVDASAAMGFEGDKVLEVRVDKNYTIDDSWMGEVCHFRIDFSGVTESEIDPGDFFGFAFGGKDEVGIMMISDYEAGFFGTWSHKGSWNICSVPLDEEDIEFGPGPSLTIVIDANLVDELYFDTVGVGSEKYPYGFKSGTSMACPGAVGAAAVIASRHYDELKSGDAESAKKLAAYVRASVRPVPALDGKVSTGGIIDLSVDEAASDPKDQPAPDITDVSVKGTEVTLTGEGFGNTKGSVVIKKYVFGKDSPVVGSEIGAWKDNSVTLSLDEDFEGIIEAELTAANGKKDTFVKFISKSENLFETDLSIDSDTGEPFEFDPPKGADSDAVQMGDAESTGIMMPLDGKIYYMPTVAEVEEEPAYRPLYCYDPDTDSWSSCPSYPEWITLASGTAFDGKLYVKGLQMMTDESGTIPTSSDYDSDNPNELLIYSYTPGDADWQECSVNEVSYGLTLFSTDDGLMLGGLNLGETKFENNYGNYVIRKYDPSKGAGEFLGASMFLLSNPVVVYAFDRIYMTDEDGETFYVLSEDLAGEIEEIDMPLLDPNKDPWAFSDPNTTKFTVTGDENMLVVIFSDYINGTGADTFILKAGESEFTPYEKRVSDAALFGPAATLMDGRLYVLSSSVFEPDKRLFRTTVLTEPEEDNAVPPGGVVPTGDDSHPELWIILAIFAVLAMTGALFLRRRKE